MASTSRLLRRQIRCERRELRKQNTSSPFQKSPLQKIHEAKPAINIHTQTTPKSFLSAFNSLKSLNLNETFIQSQFKVRKDQYNQKNNVTSGFSSKQMRFIDELKNKYGEFMTSMIIRYTTTIYCESFSELIPY